MGISDRIETFIMELLKDEDEWVELGRNELASIFNCVPSQINYVIRTRFSPQHGYVVESRRGGGGFLRIKRVNTADEINYVIKLINEDIDFSDANALITYLYSMKKIKKETAEIMLAAVNDKSLSDAGINKNKVRAVILKNMLIAADT